VKKGRAVVVTGIAGVCALLVAASVPPAAELQKKAAGIWRPLPEVVESPNHPRSPEKVDLGRILYFDPRFSINGKISCNTCHRLDNAGVDGEPTSPGHAGVRGDRNSPTVYNAALHVAQFWDGRAADVEEQAKGPVLNPVEMGMPNADYVIEVIRAIPGYRPLFEKAFPGEKDPITYDNFASAIGAFERGLVTPAPFDAFLAGDPSALSAEQLGGLETFMNVGCITCHNGVGVGGGMFQKIGLVHPYPTGDQGRAKVTNDPADASVFKVPSLRNVLATGPYFHDGKVVSIEEAVRLMAWHQLGKKLDDAQVASIVAFLGSLSGKADPAYIAKPELPPSGRAMPSPKG
jgi:cytochrome c peroxidase